ncbi:hypothetical protein AOLI_G00175820 [Acnodon oligacanthus]
MSLLCGQCGVVCHCDNAFDYWGKGTSVTVTSGVQSAPTSPLVVSACSPSSDGFITVGCVTSGFFPPESLKFSWTGGVSDVLQYPAVQQGDTYTAVTRARVNVADWNAEKPFTCKAEHPGSSTPVSSVVKKPKPSVQTPPPTPPPPPKPTQPRPHTTVPPRRTTSSGERPSIVIYKPDKTVSDSDTVFLICEVSNSDLSKVEITWLENGHQENDSISKTVIKKGNSTVALYCLTMTGEKYKKGTFTCAAKHASMPKYIQPEQVSTSNTSQSAPSVPFVVSQCSPSPDGFLTLGYVTSGFFPTESLRFSWTDGSGGAVSDAVQYPAVKAQGDQFTAVSHVRVQLVEGRAETVTCRVEHPAGNRDQDITVRANSPPTICLLECGQSIMCIIEDFYPKALSIKWKKNDREVRGQDWKTTENDSGSNRALSIIEESLAPSRSGTRYTCEVTHAGRAYRENLVSRGPSPVQPPLITTAQPWQANSPPNIRLEGFGQSIMCVIEDFYPKTLSIRWKKDDRGVRGQDWKTTENDSSSYTVKEQVLRSEVFLESSYIDRFHYFEHKQEVRESLKSQTLSHAKL